MFFLSVLVGCATSRPAPTTGDLSLCFGSDGDALADGEQQTWNITGSVTDLHTLADDENYQNLDLYPCRQAPTQLLRVLDEEGVTWTLGLTVQADGADFDGLDLAPDAQVQLQFSALQSFGETSGVVIEDSTGLVFAADEGQWGRALPDQVTPDLIVQVGERTLTLIGDCGTKEWGAIDFFATDEVQSLESGESDRLTVGASSLSVLNVGSFDYSETTCTDVAGLQSWASWR